MWNTDTPWFDTAVILGIFAFGNILFGRFEEHRPRAWRVLKLIVILGVLLGLSLTAGRAWSFGLLALMLAGAAYLHGRWLPQHGINGWTAEPRERYLELVRKKRS